MSFKSPLLIAAALAASACMHRMQEVKLSTAAEGIPAAQGAVKTSSTPNDNTKLIVQVEHLAPPGRVESGATTYVVWAKPDGSGAAQNIGALLVDDNLKGSLTTVVPFDTFEVFITAEPRPEVTAPTGQELLAANVNPR